MRRALLILLLMGSTLTLTTGQRPQRLSTLKLLLTDYYGTKLSLDSVSLRDQDGKDWAAAFDASLTARVPPGYYELKIDSNAANMIPYSESIYAVFPEASYVISLERLRPESLFGIATVRGRFEKPPPTGTVCYLSSLYGPYHFWSPVENGQFLFRGVRLGKFALTCQPDGTLPVPRLITTHAGEEQEVLIGRQ